MRIWIAALSLSLLLPGADAQKKDWVGTWAAANMPATVEKLPIGAQAVTLRQTVHISQGGKRVRITFTNEFGTTPLHISAAHLAFLSAGSKILPKTDRPLTFAGQTEVTIAPGQFTSTDAVVMTVPIYSDLVISMALPAQALPTLTSHLLGLTSTWIASGDQTSAEQFQNPSAPPPGIGQPDVTPALKAPVPDRSVVQTPPNTAQGAATVAATSGPASSLSGAQVLAKSSSWYFLKNVEVDHTRKSAALIALGDSITDGARSTPDTNRRWPDAFAALLGANKKTKAVSVLNVGISGNRILHEGTGPSALDRFDRDVATQPGARFLVITEGINDIGHTFAPPLLPVTAQQVIDGLSEIAKRAHAHGLKVFAGTLSPMGGSKYDAPQTEAMRQAVNAFLRSNTVFDGMIDFDKAVRDPDHPERMLSQLDSGDHLHPSDAGYAAMAAAINLKLFRKR